MAKKDILQRAKEIRAQRAENNLQGVEVTAENDILARAKQIRAARRGEETYSPTPVEDTAKVEEARKEHNERQATLDKMDTQRTISGIINRGLGREAEETHSMLNSLGRSIGVRDDIDYEMMAKRQQPLLDYLTTGESEHSWRMPLYNEIGTENLADIDKPIVDEQYIPRGEELIKLVGKNSGATDRTRNYGMDDHLRAGYMLHPELVSPEEVDRDIALNKINKMSPQQRKQLFDANEELRKAYGRYFEPSKVVMEGEAMPHEYGSEATGLMWSDAHPAPVEPIMRPSKDGLYHIGDETYTEDEMQNALTALIPVAQHGRRMDLNPHYRDAFAYELYGKNFNDAYYGEMDKLLAELDRLEANIAEQTRAKSQQYVETYGRPVNARATANFVSQSGANSSADNVLYIERAKDYVNSLKDNSFKAGLKEGFDLYDFATAGVSGLFQEGQLKRILDKANSGKRLTDEERTMYEVWGIMQEADALQQTFYRPEPSFWNKVGRGVGESAEMLPSFALGMGSVEAIGAKSIGLAGLKQMARKQGMKGLAKHTLNRAGVYGLRAGAATPASPMMWSNYMKRRNDQYSIVDGNLVKRETSALGDLGIAYVETFNEYYSEMLGGGASKLIDISPSMFGRLINIDKWGGKMGLGKAMDYVNSVIPSDKVRNTMINMGFSGPLTEAPSEAIGDLMTNAMLAPFSDEYGFEHFKDPNYYKELLMTTTIFGGGMGMFSVGSQINNVREVNKAIKKRDYAMSQINDESLANSLKGVMALDSIDEMSNALVGLHLETLPADQAAAAIEYIANATQVKVGTAEMMEETRMSQFADVVKRFEGFTYQGKDGTMPSDRIVAVKDKKSGETYYVTRGDYDANSDVHMLKVKNAQGEDMSVLSSAVEYIDETTLDTRLIDVYENMFGADIAAERIAEVEGAIKSMENPTREDVRAHYMRNGFQVYNNGSEVTLVDGRKAIVEGMLDNGHYLVRSVNPATQMEELFDIPFMQVLQTNDAVAKGQQKYFNDNVNEVAEDITKEEAATETTENTAETPAEATTEESAVEEQVAEDMPKELPMREDGSVDLDAITDVKTFAEQFTLASGGVQQAIESVKTMATRARKSAEELREKSKTLINANEVVDANKKAAALEERASFYDSVVAEMDTEAVDTPATDVEEVSPVEFREGDLVEHNGRGARILEVENGVAILDYSMQDGIVNRGKMEIGKAPVSELKPLAEDATAEDVTEEAVEDAVEEEIEKAENGVVDNIYAKLLPKKMRNVLDTMAKNLGVKVVFVDEVITAAGTRANADVRGNVVRIAWGNRGKSISFLAGHEYLHRMKDMGPEAYEEFKQSVIDYLGEAEWNRRIGKMKAVYESHNKRAALKGKPLLSYSEALLEEEVVADVAGELVDSHHAFDIYVNKQQGNISLLDKVREVLRAISDYIRRLGARTEAQRVNEMVGKLNTLIDRAMAEAKKKANTPTEAEVKTNANGEVEAITDEQKGQGRFSLSTYHDGGRATLATFLDGRVAEGALTEVEATDMLTELDEIAAVCEEFKDKYVPFGVWSEAKVEVDEEGDPVFSVIKANGDYAMNLDFSLVCKKRRTLDAVLNQMVRRGMIKGVSQKDTTIAKINEVIRKYGFETACALCFVDARRFQVIKTARQFCDIYNDTVDFLIPKKSNIAVNEFNFAGRKDVVVSENSLDTMSDDALNVEALRKIGYKVVGKTKDGKDMYPKTVVAKIARHLVEHPEDRKHLSPSDFVSTAGFDKVKAQKPEIMKLYNAKKGTGGPKAAFSDVQYLNDIIRSNWKVEEAYAVGGVRLQSFSDYVPRMVFDYIQMVAELAAKKLPVHAYTKEPLFAKTFGLTGIKINLSLVPDVVGGGVAPGLDAEGNYVWKENETFPYEEAVELQNAEGYKNNCGTIAVGISDEHIWKMLDDVNIRMVIPYHKSGLPKQVAKMNNVAAFTDYTKEQNTRNGGRALTKEEAKQVPNYNELLRETNDPRKAAQAYLDWCAERGYTPKFEKFAGHPNYYKLLEDFTTLVDETYVPQQGVTFTFPTENDAFGSLESLIEQGLEEDAILEGQRDVNVGAIVEEVGEVLGVQPKFSLIGEIGAANLDKAEEATTRLDNLAIAREMEAAGKDAKAIKMATGWERGADGLWRYEIEDNIPSDIVDRLNNSPMRDIYGVGRHKGARLGKLLGDDHPLFSAYPFMKWVEVIYENLPMGEYGSFAKDNSVIRITTNENVADEKKRSILAHEVQHAIQQAEGFAEGGSPYMDTPMTPSAKARVEAVKDVNTFTLALPDAGMPVSEAIKTHNALWESLTDDAKRFVEDALEYNPYLSVYGLMKETWSANVPARPLGAEGYKRLAGEVEARNVEKRLDMTMAERLASLAEETEDVAREEQIILREGLTMGAQSEARFSLRVVQGVYDALKEYEATSDIETFVNKVRDVNDNIALGHPYLTNALLDYDEFGADEFERTVRMIVGDYDDGGYAPYTAGGAKFSLATDVASILEEYDTEGVKYGSILDVADGIEAVIAESTEDTTELENILNYFRAAQDDARRWGNRMDSGGEEEFEEALRAYASQSEARYSLSERVEILFNKAVSGDITGKPISIGTLTSEGKKYLEKISGLKFRDKVDFVLNPSDLRHIYNEHYGDNEKDKGNNIPLNIHDIRRIIDVVSFPQRIVYGVDKKGLKCFFFLMESAEGTYNLLEIYSDGKGTMNSKTYYKTKKGVSQRAINLNDSLHSTSETDGATLSDAKIPQIFELPKIEARNSLRELDAPYLDAVERGDMETAQRMVMEAAKRAGYTIRAFHGTPNKVYNPDWKEAVAEIIAILYPSVGQINLDAEYGTEEYKKAWELANEVRYYYRDYKAKLPQTLQKRFERGITKPFTVFDTTKRGSSTGAIDAYTGFFFSPNPLFASSFRATYTKDPLTGVISKTSTGDGVLYDVVIKPNNILDLRSLPATRSKAKQMGNTDGYDVVINKVKDGRNNNKVEEEIVVKEPSLIKSADPITYDDNGNVIPLSERFNPNKEDIRYSLEEIINTPSDEEHKTQMLALAQQMERDAESRGLDVAQEIADTTGWVHLDDGTWKYYGDVDITEDAAERTAVRRWLESKAAVKKSRTRKMYYPLIREQNQLIRDFLKSQYDAMTEKEKKLVETVFDYKSKNKTKQQAKRKKALDKLSGGYAAIREAMETISKLENERDEALAQIDADLREELADAEANPDKYERAYEEESSWNAQFDIYTGALQKARNEVARMERNLSNARLSQREKSAAMRAMKKAVTEMLRGDLGRYTRKRDIQALMNAVNEAQTTYSMMRAIDKAMMTINELRLRKEEARMHNLLKMRIVLNETNLDPHTFLNNMVRSGQMTPAVARRVLDNYWRGINSSGIPVAKGVDGDTAKVMDFISYWSNLDTFLAETGVGEEGIDAAIETIWRELNGEAVEKPIITRYDNVTAEEVTDTQRKFQGWSKASPEQRGEMAKAVGLIHGYLQVQQAIRNMNRESGTLAIEEDISKERKAIKELHKKIEKLKGEKIVVDDETIKDAEKQIREHEKAIDSLLRARLNARMKSAGKYNAGMPMVVEQLYQLNSAVEDLLHSGKINLQHFRGAQQEHQRELINMALEDIDKPQDETKHKHDYTAMQKIQAAWPVRYFRKHLPSMEHMLRRMGRNSVDGEGKVFNYFQTNLMRAHNRIFEETAKCNEMLTAKTEALFGEGMTYNRVMRKAERKVIGTVTERNGNDVAVQEYTIANALYTIAMWEQPIGRATLVKQGITEGVIKDLRARLNKDNPAWLEFERWVVDDFLPSRRVKYNAVYREMNGTDMGFEVNYFPIRRREPKKYQSVDLASPSFENKPSTMTGALIERTDNVMPIDIESSFFGVLKDNITEMEQWSEMAPVTRDFNLMLSSPRVKSAMDAIDEHFYEDFSEAAKVATLNYTGDQKKEDDILMQVALRMWGASKLAWKKYTALKQVTSGVLALPYSADPKFLGRLVWYASGGKGMVSDAVLEKIGRGDLAVKEQGEPLLNIQWAIKNSPMFKRRWQSGVAGNDIFTRELKYEDHTKGKRAIRDISQGLDWFAQLGMKPIAFVDACTVATIMRAVYDYERAALLADGYSEEEANEKAMFRAELFANKTQQSSETEYLSPLQMERGVTSMITIFQNAPFAQGRMMADAWNELTRDIDAEIATATTQEYNDLCKHKYAEDIKAVEDTIAKEKKAGVITNNEEETMRRDQLMRPLNEKIKEEAATRAAERISNAKFKAVRTFIYNGWLGQAVFNISGYLPYLIFGDDDEKKKVMLKDWLKMSMLGPIGTVPLGSALLSAINGHQLSLLGAFAELEEGANNIAKYIREGEWSEVLFTVGDFLFNKLAGVDYKTWLNAWAGIENMFEEGMSAEAMLRAMNAPESQMRLLIGDRKEGETYEEYTTRIMRMYTTIFSDAEYGDYYDDKGKRKKDADAPFGMTEKQMNEMHKTYDKAYRANVVSTKGGAQEWANTVAVDKAYTEAVEALGWKANTKPKVKGQRAYDIEKKRYYLVDAPIEGMTIEEYNTLVSLGNAVAIAARNEEKYLGQDDETYLEYVREEVEAKREFMAEYNKIIDK